MNSQQELLDAINTISANKDRSFDTPAEVLRVEGDTVWVHIDGGADETPVQKTINCEQGDTVQVRISSGSAFLVGNASAPPTDDTTANVAHFVAEQADEKATKAVKTVDALVTTVEGKVSAGDSNIHNLSSTIYQNANGVNIYNDSLAVGDSYAHIDEDEFCIREVTSAGFIDDTNDPVFASFGKTETNITCGEQFITLTPTSITLGDTDNVMGNAAGWEITREKIEHIGDAYSGYRITLDNSGGYAKFEYANSVMAPDKTQVYTGGALFSICDIVGEGRNNKWTKIDGDKISCTDTTSSLLGDITEITGTYIKLSGEVLDRTGNRKYVAEPSSEGTSGQVLTTDGNGGRSWTSVGGGGGPTVLTSSTISSSTTSYTFTDNAIEADSVIDIYDTIFGFAPTDVQTIAGSCTITFPAQSSSHTIKIFIY